MSWDDTRALEHHKFRLQLENPALDQLLNNETLLRVIRYDNDRLRGYEKMLAHALKARSMCLANEVYQRTKAMTKITLKD